MTAYKQQAL